MRCACPYETPSHRPAWPPAGVAPVPPTRYDRPWPSMLPRRLTGIHRRGVPMRRPIRAPRRPLALLALLGLLLAAMPVSAAAAPSDVIPNIQVVWARTDSPQARGDRPFVWGPQPVLPA